MSPRPLATETAVAAVASTLLAVAMTWPTARHPIRTIPQDTYDPSLQAWQVAWGGHALRHHPLGIWTTNAVFPEHLSLAFSDSLLGYAPFGLLGSGPSAAIFRYNALFVLSFAVAALGLYALVRQLGADRAAAVVTAVAFAYAPWRFAHAGHLNILSTGGIPLALAMLARGHDWSFRSDHSPETVRPAWAFAGWLTAAGQVSLGFGLGTPFVYVLAGLAVVTALGWFRRHRRGPAPAHLLRADLAGGALFLLITAALAVPYLRVLAEHPDARRTVDWLDLMSPSVQGFFLAGEHSWLWGSAQQGARSQLAVGGEMELLPGFTVLALAGLGLFRSAWTVRARLFLVLGVVISAWMALGTRTPGNGRYGYLLLYRFLPGFDGSRTPGRLVLWTILLLCLLAAGALTRSSPGRPIARRFPSRRSLALTLALLGVLAEGVNRTPHPPVPTAPVSLAALPSPTLVLPTDELADLHVMLWSTADFPTVLNGSSGYNPPNRQAFRDAMGTFPDRRSVRLLRSLGVRTVVVLPEAAGTAYEWALGQTGRRFGLERSDHHGAAVFTL